MISEPELDSPFLPPERRGGPAGPEEVRAERPPGPRRAWAWTLLGAVVASAAWGGVLYTAGGGEDSPVLRHRKPVNLCDEVRVQALSRVLGALRNETTRAEAEHPAVDWFSCALRAEELPKTGKDGQPVDGWTRTSQVIVTMAVHRTGDPEPGYDADLDHVSWRGEEEIKREQVPGLGEQALLATGATLEGPQLRVVDGTTVFTLTAVQGYNYSGENGPTEPEPEDRVDETELHAAMIEDMQTLVTTLAE
ncbi:hypothetical protein LG634_33995 [Streptomyces bambusae]|uniref:hypothetical protein n=1 Tax=Streptomyces bambusae TaxID=1550616 RepID=UPI001CFF913A|nr:hypothetical protein [Streptomyces bambusae]MCB5169801.1 hypothetical protein [Streptomyces bambusae]